jgi:hypothetical protein
MALDYTGIIKNNDVVRGKFSLCETNSADLSRKEFFPPSTYISIERQDVLNICRIILLIITRYKMASILF